MKAEIKKLAPFAIQDCINTYNQSGLLASELLQQRNQCFSILKSILLDSFEESESDHAIYELLKDANELPVNYVPYWMADELEDSEGAPATDLIQDNFELGGYRVDRMFKATTDYLDGKGGNHGC